jgi:hypothetical protein|tara:strand:- start:836 stop:1186 length:351 start_codon:yes stop_codon:yes gene_type:complete
MVKQLQENSAYARLDSDGDGIVSDAEMMAAERAAELDAKIERWRNQDALEDRQRMIALIAMLSGICIVFWLLTPFVSIDRIEATNALVNLFLTFNTGVVIGFMGLSALGKIKGRKD